ncbi:MAG: hypothetical protein DRP01_00820 [Archaeoglobales archaeon]|nr:MAG: hypothetical protein DRP01_00820 [Archaeoglobales archaeon]
MMRIVRIVLNSFCFLLLIFIGVYFIPYNPLLAIFFFLAAFDQLEDVIYYTTKKSIIPPELFVIDFFFEIAMALIGLSLIYFGFVYFGKFFHEVFVLTSFLGMLIVYTSIEDIYIMLRERYGIQVRRGRKKYIEE